MDRFITQIGEGTEDTRKQVFKADLITTKHSETLVDKTLEHLADERLVVMKTLTSRSDYEKPVTVVDVAHEALIRHWPRLREWLNENQDALRKQREIDTAAKEWEAHGKPKHAAYLLQGPKLNTAEDYVNNYADKVPLSTLAQDFIQASVALQEQEIAKEKQRQEEREQLLRETQQQAQTLLIEKLGMQSVLATQLPNASNGYYEQALLLAIQAFKEKNTAITRSNLLRVLQAKKQQKVLYGHSNWVDSVAFSPNGKILASGSWDNTVRLWNVGTRKPLGEPLLPVVLKHNAIILLQQTNRC